MSYEQILSQLGQFVGTAGIILYLIRNNSEKLDSLIKDMTALTTIHRDCTIKQDHDRLNILEHECAIRCKKQPSRRARS